MTCLTRCSKSNSSLYSNGRIKFLLLEFFKLNTSYYNIINFGNKLILQLTVLLSLLLIILLIKILNLWKKIFKITNDIIKAVYAHISKRYNIDNIRVFEFITKQADINNQACNDYILDYYKHFILKPNAISNGIIDKVFKYIAIKTNLSNNKIDELIKDKAIEANKSVDDYMLDYYNNVILKDDESDSIDVEDIDKVNFEELTVTDKIVINRRKYMCNEYIKEIVCMLNELIDSNLSDNRRAVDESAVIMYAIQAIERDVANAVSDCQKVLKLIKQKQS